ncbi:MAG: hypothetical protein AAGD35_16400 [Actinomycetota bacterium]
MTEGQKRMELVVERSGSTRTSLIGLALLASLVLGFGPLRDAATGAGPFELAIGRFLLVLAVCVIAASVLGRMLDANAPAPTLQKSNDRPMEDTEGST